MRSACYLKGWALAVVFALGAFAPAWARWESETLISHGSPQNRIDLVFLGDGYTADEQATFADDVNRTVQVLFAETPFLEYASYWNVHVVYVVSRESGIDHPYPYPPIYRDTALDFVHNGGCAGTPSTAPNKVLTAAADAPAPPDVIVVLINDEPVAGCANSRYATVVMGTDDLGLHYVAHELGHLFGRLQDEGVAGGTYRGSEPSSPNVTTKTLRDEIKWKDWIEPDTPIPTSGPSEDIGLFEGALRFSYGIYRPTHMSKMGSARAPWGPVNGEALIKQMYAVVTPIENSAPAEVIQDLREKGQETFAVTTLAPSTGPLHVEWQLDGRPVGVGPEITLRTGDAPAGDHVLAAVVEDLTPLVRNRTTGPALSAVASWTVRFPNHPPQVMVPEPITTGVGEGVRFTVTAADPDGNLETLEIVDAPSNAFITFVVRGDLDRDARVNTRDEPRLISALFNQKEITFAERQAADVNGDGPFSPHVSAADLTAFSGTLGGTKLTGWFFGVSEPLGGAVLRFLARDTQGEEATASVLVTLRPTPTPIRH